MIGYLKNSNIGGGSVVDISIRSLTSNWDVYIQDNPTPAKACIPWNPHELDFLGVGNQKFVLGGHFIEGSTANNAGSSIMQIGLLGSFCNIGSPSWFILDAKHFMAGVASIQVLPSAPKITTNFKNEDEIDYNITVAETASW